jgi:acyl carrier protein
MMSTTATEIATTLRGFVLDRFLFGDTSASLSNSESLLERGVVDSTGVLELVAFLEEKFGIQVSDDELIPENLESIQKAADFVTRKQR